MKILEYENFEVDFPYFHFSYKYENQEYKYKVTINNLSKVALAGKNTEIIDSIVFHIGMTIIPYLFCLDDFDKIIVKSYILPVETINFFSNYYSEGLREFRWQNRLDVHKKVDIEFSSKKELPQPIKSLALEEALLLNGGGKDSAVAGEILKEIKLPFAWFAWRPSKASLSKIQVSENDNVVMGHIDYSPLITKPKYVGNKPLMGQLGFISLLVAYLLDTKYIIVANEYSSNFPNLIFQGIEINHQYCKSYEFEVSLTEYIKKNIVADIHYFSILSPLYEIQIAKIFSHYAKYFYSFISCNMGEKSNYWCGKCAKCGAVFLLLYPFLKEKEIKDIFGVNLFFDKDIQKIIINLCIGKIKPLDCVGTQEESTLALKMAFNKNPSLRHLFPNNFLGTIDNISLEELKLNCLESWNRNNNIPHNLWVKVDNYFNRYIND